MLTVGALLAVVYLCRRPSIWVGAHLIAFALGFVVGWEAMKRR